MKFLLSVLMLSLLSLNVACNRDNNDSIMEREEAPVDRMGDDIEDGVDEAGDNIEDGAEELDN